MPEPRSQAAYPFPVAEDARQVAWWDQMPEYEQKRWFQLVKAMTPEERRAFHEDRRGTAAKFGLDDDSIQAGYLRGKRQEQEGLLYARWRAAVQARRAAKAEVRP